jgi:hypothetical protein
MDMQAFLKNREQFPAAQLAKYAGKYVAWSPDGTRILASDEDELRLANTIREAGYNSTAVLIAFVPAGDEILQGGGLEAND